MTLPSSLLAPRSSLLSNRRAEFPAEFPGWGTGTPPLPPPVITTPERGDEEERRREGERKQNENFEARLPQSSSSPEQHGALGSGRLKFPSRATKSRWVTSGRSLKFRIKAPDPPEDPSGASDSAGREQRLVSGHDARQSTLPPRVLPRGTGTTPSTTPRY